MLVITGGHLPSCWYDLPHLLWSLFTGRFWLGGGWDSCYGYVWFCLDYFSFVFL